VTNKAIWIIIAVQKINLRFKMSADLPNLQQYNDSKYLIKRLFTTHLSPYLKPMSVALLCMVVAAVTGVGLPFVMEFLVDDFFVKKDQEMLLNIVGFVLLLFLLRGSSLFYQNYLMGCIGQRIIVDMQMLLYRHLLKLDLAQVSGESTGKIISRFTNDINILRASVNIIMTGLARESLMLTLLVSFMFYQNFTLALIAFAAFPFAIYPIIRLGKRMRKISNKTQEGMGEFTERLDETFRAVRVIKAYMQEDFETKKANTAVENIYLIMKKAIRNQAAASPIMETVSGVAIAAVIWYGGAQIVDGVTTGGKLVSFISAAVAAYKPAKTLSSMNTTLQDGLAAARRLFVLLDTSPTIIDNKNAVDLKIVSKGADVKFENVIFGYNKTTEVLKGLNLDIKAGQTAALVGPSGGGKSTVMNLLLRFYDIDSGSIKIDRHDISDIKISSLRDNLSYVGQNIKLFDDTIAANIAYGRPGASMEDIKNAATMAAADEFIKLLPSGYDTRIGQDGALLSGGQCQRISIARAILKASPILLLDEATSALDKVSEVKIQLALEKLMQNRTTIVIAHRLSTIEKADQIFVIKNGKVVESGKHDSLLKESGEYNKLYKGLQSQDAK
jgi:subfamily B ATP-binding cassette protein MsbA